MRDTRVVCFAMLLSLIRMPFASAQQVGLPPGAAASDSALAAATPGLARQVLAQYRDASGGAGRDGYLDTLFRLQVAAGRDSAAAGTLDSLRELRRARNPVQAAVTLPYEIYVAARIGQAADGLAFDQAFARAYRAVVGGLGDTTAAYEVPWVFGTSLRMLEANLRVALARHQGVDSMAVADGADLVRRYLAVQVYRSFQPLIADLQAEDDRRRYVIDANVLVETPDGARICTLVMRPRAAPGPLPALLNFSIYANDNHVNEVRLTAAHGYAGVGGLTRGKACSPDRPVPIEHDGADAAALIEWIARQPWSDGRVGMYGGSYDGFAQWAAAKHMPRALKAMMPSVTFAPGIDFPMDGNVFMSYAYPWPFYTTNVKGLDDSTYYDAERWSRLNHDWYVGGRAYRDLDAIDGTPNPFFDRWLEHPGYDAYWQAAIPYRDEFARIRIPVLTTTGYYDSGQIGALHYFARHHEYAPGADHYLLIGPYDHVRGQRGTISPTGSKGAALRRYPLDSVAHLDIVRLRYQWFDYVLRGGPKPALLRDKVNYEVMGANVWKHAPSLAAMGDHRRRFHLTAVRSGRGYRLSDRRPARGTTVVQQVDLADRTDAARMAPGGDLIDQALDDWPIVADAPHIGNAIEFVGEPLAQPTEVSGLFSGWLEFTTNKADFDVGVTLFELTPEGEYVQLSYYWTRASYAADRSHRRLLARGRRQHLDFTSGRLTSRRLAAGSRLVVVLGVIKQAGEQINYGTGKDVSEETIADAGEPLEIRWFGDSFIDVPVAR